MGEAGRKLTIRMPDNPRLRSAEVGKLHLDPGARVRVGSPIMTLVSRKKDHMVRAPRPGRVVPLVAPGDEVNGGDPLYILNIDEVALAEAKRDQRELVAVEKAKWSQGLTPEVIEPVMRQRADAANKKGNLQDLVAAWAKPALAMALYILACFALLPILNTFGREASTGTLIAMCVGCVLFGALIFHLYAPDSGWWPRWTVRLVATSWIAISSIAIFYQQDTPDDITLADATAPLTRLFTTPEEVSVPVPDVAPKTPVILASGIAAGRTDERPVPDYGLPKSVLGEPAEVPDPHGVQVLAWGRVVPTNQSGDVLVFDQADVVPAEMLVAAAPALGVVAEVTATDLATTTEETELSVALATPPDLSVFEALAGADGKSRLQVAHANETAVPTIPSTDEEPAIAAGRDSDLLGRVAAVIQQTADGATQPDTSVAALSSWLGSSPVPVLVSDAPQGPTSEPLPAIRTAVDGGPAKRQSRPITSNAGQASLPVLAAAETGSWLTDAAVPVLQSDSPSGPAADPEPTAAAALDATPAAAEDVRLALADVNSRRQGHAAVPSIANRPSTVAVILSDTLADPGSDPVAPTAGGEDTIDGTSLAAISPQDQAKAVSLFSSIAPEAVPNDGLEIAILRSDRAGVRDIADAPDVFVALLSAPARGVSPASLRPGTEPELALFAQRNAVRESWMFDQSDRLAGIEAETGLVLSLEDAAALTPGVQQLAAIPSEQGGIVRTPVSDGPIELAVLEGGLASNAGFGAPLAAIDGLAIIGPAPDLGSELQVAAIPSDVPTAPPWQPEPEPELAERLLLFLFYDDPRLKELPSVGDDWQPLMSPDLAEAVQVSKVEAVNEVLEVTNWCAAANDPGGKKEKFLPGGAYRTAVLGDRIRLLQVRVALPEDKLAMLEQEVPVFGDGPSGFFHNKMPLFGAKPDEAVMDKARAFMQASSNAEIDKNTPPGMKGGHYFTSADSLARAMQANGCAGAIFNDGDGPVNEIGRILDATLAG